MPYVIRRDVSDGTWQRHRCVIGRGEIERRRKVARDCTPPLGDVAFHDAGILRPKSTFDKSNERCMVKHLRVYPTSLTPRRDDDHGYAHAHSVRAGRIFRAPREDLIRRVDVGEALGSGLRDGRRRDVVEEAVIFIVRQKEYRLTPNVRMIRQRIQYLRHIPCSVVCRPIWMLRVRLRCDDPRYLWQVAARDILSEYVKECSSYRDVGSCFRSVGERGSRLRVLILVEVKKRIVSVVANVGVLSK